MGIAVAEIREDENDLAYWNAAADSLAIYLPLSLRGSIALARSGREPAERIIARRGIFTIADEYPRGRR